MAKAKSDTTLTLDELIEEMAGKEGVVHQPGKGKWSDKDGAPHVYRVVSADEPEDGVFTLRLESVERLQRFHEADRKKGTAARWETTDKPRSVVPNCPLKWFRPA